MRMLITDLATPRGPLLAKLMLVWYMTLFLLMAISPVDPRIWWGANVLPIIFVTALVVTFRRFPLSTTSYLLISLWLTLHTIAVHYTYPQVPMGLWLDQWFDFQRNHFDRIVHFAFGFLFTPPLAEIFRRVATARGWLLPYLVIISILGFSALWEIAEAWIGQIAHPDVERAMVGHQGDVWDPQRDMASAFYGSLACVGLLQLARRFKQARKEPLPEEAAEEMTAVSIRASVQEER
ncbi:membrane protein [Nitrospira sp.]|nr:membrane protein [Nitrospira sp.]